MTDMSNPGDASGRDESHGPSATDEPPPEQEPTTTGTMFIMLLFLMALAGMWFLMYMVLLER